MKLYLLGALCALAAACAPQQQATSTAAAAPASMLQCAKDTDCKGDRICEKGVCQAPSAAANPTANAPASAAPQLPAPVPGNPKFKDYPVDVYQGPVGKLDMTDETARTFRTRLTEAMQGAPEFAGEYTLMTMGCGSSGCITQMFVSRKTGRVIAENFGSSSAYGVTDENGEDIRVGDTIEGMKPDSRLLVVRTQTDPNEEDDKAEIHAVAKFFVLEKDTLKLIKTVPLPDPVVRPIDDV